MSQVEIEQQQPHIHEAPENSDAQQQQQQEEHHQETIGNGAKFQLDLRHPGSFDCCWQMLAQKVL